MSDEEEAELGQSSANHEKSKMPSPYSAREALMAQTSSHQKQQQILSSTRRQTPSFLTVASAPSKPNASSAVPPRSSMSSTPRQSLFSSSLGNRASSNSNSNINFSSSTSGASFSTSKPSTPIDDWFATPSKPSILRKDPALPVTATVSLTPASLSSSSGQKLASFSSLTKTAGNVSPSPVSSISPSTPSLRIVQHKFPSSAAPSTFASVVISPSTSSSSNSSSSLSPSTIDISGYLSKLNDKQYEAVMAPPGPLLIVASAGSGKTLTLTTRMLRLLSEGTALPSQLLAITFTVKAAEEMRARIERALGWLNASAIHICNFHSLALRILREHWVECHFRQQFQVLSLQEQRDLIRECVMQVFERKLSAAAAMRGKLDVQQLVGGKLMVENSDAEVQESRYSEVMAGVRADERRHSASSSSGHDGNEGSNKHRNQQANDLVPSEVVQYFVNFIRSAKSKNKRPSDYTTEHRDVFNAYAGLCQQRGLIDFGDMLPMALDLLKRRPEILRKYQGIYRFVFVDEYQDIDATQFELITLLARDHQNLTVCGDDDQSIYGWRGSSAHSFSMFASAFPHHRDIVLAQTYRSTKRLCRAVNALIEQNTNRTKKTLWTENEDGAPIRLLVSADAGRECDLVVATIQQQLRDQLHCKWSQIAILARTRRVITAFESVLKKAGVPTFSTVNSNSKRKLDISRSREIQDILAYCDLLCSDSADTAFRRVYNLPKRQIGPNILEEIESLARVESRKSSSTSSLMAIARKCCQPQHKALQPKQKSKLSEFVNLIDRLRADLSECNVRELLSILISDINYMEHLQRTCSSSTSSTSSSITSSDFQQRSETITALLERAATFDLERQDFFAKAAVRSNSPSTNALSMSANSSSSPALQALSEFIKQLRQSDSNSSSMSSVDEGSSKQAPDVIFLSTVHQAKGMEFDYVFVVRFNEGIMPLTSRGSALEEENSSKDEKTAAEEAVQQLEEERRLAYVACSRAKKQLYLSFILTDFMGNACQPSRYLTDFPADTLDNAQSTTSIASSDGSGCNYELTASTSTAMSDSSKTFLNLLQKGSTSSFNAAVFSTSKHQAGNGSSSSSSFCSTDATDLSKYQSDFNLDPSQFVHPDDVVERIDENTSPNPRSVPDEKYRSCTRSPSPSSKKRFRYADRSPSPNRSISQIEQSQQLLIMPSRHENICSNPDSQIPLQSSGTCSSSSSSKSSKFHSTAPALPSTQSQFDNDDDETGSVWAGDASQASKMLFRPASSLLSCKSSTSSGSSPPPSSVPASTSSAPITAAASRFASPSMSLSARLLANKSISLVASSSSDVSSTQTSDSKSTSAPTPLTSSFGLFTSKLFSRSLFAPKPST